MRYSPGHRRPAPNPLVYPPHLSGPPNLNRPLFPEPLNIKCPFSCTSVYLFEAHPVYLLKLHFPAKCTFKSDTPYRIDPLELKEVRGLWPLRVQRSVASLPQIEGARWRHLFTATALWTPPHGGHIFLPTASLKKEEVGCKPHAKPLSSPKAPSPSQPRLDRQPPNLDHGQLLPPSRTPFMVYMRPSIVFSSCIICHVLVLSPSQLKPITTSAASGGHHPDRQETRTCFSPAQS